MYAKETLGYNGALVIGDEINNRTAKVERSRDCVMKKGSVLK